MSKEVTEGDDNSTLFVHQMWHLTSVTAYFREHQLEIAWKVKGRANRAQAKEMLDSE